ncbi:MAG: VOC family protein [Gemmataceae bacterium]
MPRFTQFEIPADDPEKLANFYRRLFDWQIEKVPVEGFEYWFCKTGEGPGINGAIVGKLTPDQTVMNYLPVENIQKWIDEALTLGGDIVVPKSPVAGMGWYAIVRDPENNMFGLWENDKEAQ